MPVHPTPQQSAPTKVTPVDWSKVRLRPIRLVSKDPNKLTKPAPNR